VPTVATQCVVLCSGWAAFLCWPYCPISMFAVEFVGCNLSNWNFSHSKVLCLKQFAAYAESGCIEAKCPILP